MSRTGSSGPIGVSAAPKGMNQLPNVTATSRSLAISPTSTPPPTMTTAKNQPPPSTPSVTPQQLLWTSLKLDPLLIQHATGLHRVLRDIQQLRDQFQSFASHLLQMTKTGASMTAHLEHIYKAETCPESIHMLAATHTAMSNSGVDWFSSQFKNSILNLFSDWIEDAEDVLSQLGLVQKTRHELDGLQDEVEKLFTKKLESPIWDSHAERSLQKKLENCKEKLAAAAILYDGQRRGVEKSMKFLLDQRAQLFHQVISCFGEYEYRFFRDFSAHAAAFVSAYPYSSQPPELQFAEEPFGTNHDVTQTEQSASALLLSLPYFQWSDGDESTEGPSVRAIRRSMAQTDKRGSIKTSAVLDTKEEMTESNPAPSTNESEAAWEADAKDWNAKQAVTDSVTASTDKESSNSNESHEIDSKIIEQSNAQLSEQLKSAGYQLNSNANSSHPITSTDEQVEDISLTEITAPPSSSPASILKPKTHKHKKLKHTQSPNMSSPSDSPVIGTPESDATDSDADDSEEFVSPLPFEEQIRAAALATVPSAISVHALTPTLSEVDLLRELDAQGTAAAAFNLPAKFLPNPRPSVKLHPALWEAIDLTQVKGSIWGKILVEHIQFDEATDEMHEKYSLLPDVIKIFEHAFQTEMSWSGFKELALKEKQWKEEQQQLMDQQQFQLQQRLTSHDHTVTTKKTSQDKFVDMKKIDGSLFAVPPTPNTTSFPASPFPNFSAKQWWVAYQILTRILFPLTPEQIVEALYRMDDKLLTPPRIQGLLRLMPNEEQRKSILSTDRPTPLTPIEQLYTLLSRTTSPSLEIRLSSLHFQSEFGHLSNHLEETLASIERCCVEIKKSVNLRIIFAILLSFGNFMNLSHGTIPSYGFHLEFLTQIRKIKMSHTQSTLLDFLVYYISTYYSQLSLSTFSIHAFPHLTKVLKFDEWKFVMEMRYLNEEYSKVKQMVETDEYEKQNRSVTSSTMGASDPSSSSCETPASPPELPFQLTSFPPRVPRFLSYLQSRTTVLRYQYLKVKADIMDLCKYLCIPSTSVEDPVADAGGISFIHTMASHPNLHPSGSDLGFANLPPLGEVPPQDNTEATLESSSAMSHETSGTLHTRFDWLHGLGVLQTFINEFHLAFSDYQVSTRVHQPSNTTGGSIKK